MTKGESYVIIEKNETGECRMKKGINIWSFPTQSLKDNFSLAKKAGFEGVEISLEAEGELTLNTTEKELKGIKDLANGTGLELYSLTCGLCWDYRLTDDDKKNAEKAKDMIKRQLEAANILGCDTILVIAGVVQAYFSYPEKKVDYLTCYERSIEAINELKPFAEAAGVCMGIENVANKFLLSPLEMRSFIDSFDSKYVGSYFDVGNVMEDRGYPEDWIRILGQRIKKIHLKDYRLGAGEYGNVDLLAGDVNFPEVIKALNEVNYDGWLTAEMIPNYRYYTDTIIYNTSNAMDRIMGRVK